MGLWSACRTTVVATLLVLLGFLPVLKENRSYLALEMRSTAPNNVQLFYDLGNGFSEAESSRALVTRESEWQLVRLPIGDGNLRGLRLDPATDDAAIDIRRISLHAYDGRLILDIDPGSLRPLNQIADISQFDGFWKIIPVRNAIDPYVAVPVQSISLRSWNGRLLGRMLVAVLLTAIGLTVAATTLKSKVMAGLSVLAARKQFLTVAAFALFASVLSSWPVVFGGKSFLSPNNGVLLLYDTLPTVPKSIESGSEPVHGADVGAMAWQHFTYTLLQERTIKIDGELPLWNRFNGSGRTMLGQGQSMLGDPLNWLVGWIGTSAWSFDLKFVILRALFAFALGVTVLMLSRGFSAALLITLSTPFVTYFIYRVNHPAIFTLCYSPLVLLAWIGLLRAEPRKIPWWAAGLVVANWLLINSGTGKEAYVLLALLNAVGTVILLLNRRQLRAPFPLVMVSSLGSLACFVAVSTPIWATFLDAIRYGSTVSQEPAAHFLSLPALLGFADNLYFLFSYNRYWPGVNFVVFAGAIIGAAYASGWRFRDARDRNTAIVLTGVLLFCFVLAFGLVPSPLIVSIPIVNSIQHIHNTFLTAAIVPASVLAGIGFSRLRGCTRARAARVERIVLTSIVILLCISLAFTSSPGIKPQYVLLYTAMVMGTLVILFKLVRLKNLAEISPSLVGLSIVAFTLLLGRGAAWEKTPFDHVVFNPQPRVDLLAESVTVSEARKFLNPPVRAIGTGNTFFSGYRAALGFESIDGADAFEGRSYRALTQVLNLPYGWYWRMDFKHENLVQHAAALDMLGVGIVFSNEALDGLPGFTPIAAEPRLRAYFREGAWPRAFFSDRVVPYSSLTSLSQLVQQRAGPFIAIDTTRLAGSEHLRALIRYPSWKTTLIPASNYKLTSNTTSFIIEAPNAGVAYLGESDEAGDFIVHVNGIRSGYFSANHAFKAIYIPKAGTYEITVRYWPARLNAYLMASAIGLAALFGLLTWCWRAARTSRDSGTSIASISR